MRCSEVKSIQLKKNSKLFIVDELPEGWERAKLSEIANINMGQSPPGHSYNDQGDGLPFYQGKADFGEWNPTARVWCIEPKKIAMPGDVLFSVRAPVGPTNIANCKCIIGRGLAALTPLDGIPTEFVLFALRLLEPKLALSGTGSTFTAIRKQDLKKIRINVPPVNEQKRIVAKVKELLARVNAARERLAKVQEILKRFRQSVIAAACSGRLTADWRVENPKLEPASQIFKRVCVERRENYKAECTKAKKENRKIPKKPDNLEPRKVNINELPEIPAEWMWVYLPDFGYMNRGKSRHRPRNAPHLYDGPYPFIQTGDIAQSGGLITSHRQTYNEAGLAQSRIWPAGTVCITIAANIASSAILTYPACFPDSVVGVIPDEDLCLDEYLEYFLRTARSDLDQFAPATSQKNINIAILSDVAVPLPTFTEQHEIVCRVSALSRMADAIEKRVKIASTQAEMMTQAILAKAFQGELVPTEAELARQEGRPYEPASALLAKIKAKRKDVKPQRKRGRALQRKNNISDLTS